MNEKQQEALGKDANLGKDVKDPKNAQDSGQSNSKDNGRRGRRGRHGRGRKGGFGKDQSNVRKGKMFNDIADYMKNKEIAEAFAKLPFSFITGGKIPGFNPLSAVKMAVTSVISYIVDWNVADTSVDTVTNVGTPSILDQVKTIIYTAMRRANAGATNAIESIDVMISNLIASIDIYCNAVYFAKLFKIVNTFSWRNRTIPRVIFSLMGIDYDDFVANLANYRGRFNVFVAQAKTIRTLANFPFLNVAIAEYANIFKDQDTDTGREQIIVPIKAFHHVFDSAGTTAHPGGTVRLMKIGDFIANTGGQTDGIIFTASDSTGNSGSGLIKFSKILDLMYAQVNILVNDAEFNLIQADIEKAFGEQSAYMELDGIANTDGPIELVYSEEFLQMFHNGTFLPEPEMLAPIVQNGFRAYARENCYTNTIYQLGDTSLRSTRFGVEVHYASREETHPSTPIVKLVTEDADGLYLGGLVDCDFHDPAPEQIIAMTRYKQKFIKLTKDSIPADFRVASTSDYYYLRTKGTGCFILMGWKMEEVVYDPTALTTTLEVKDILTQQIFQQSLPNTIYPLLAVNHYPILLLNVSAVSATPKWVPLFEINNFRFITANELESINLSCFLSLWNLPERTNI